MPGWQLCPGLSLSCAPTLSPPQPGPGMDQLGCSQLAYGKVGISHSWPSAGASDPRQFLVNCLHSLQHFCPGGGPSAPQGTPIPPSQH